MRTPAHLDGYTKQQMSCTVDLCASWVGSLHLPFNFVVIVLVKICPALAFALHFGTLNSTLVMGIQLATAVSVTRVTVFMLCEMLLHFASFHIKGQAELITCLYQLCCWTAELTQSVCNVDELILDDCLLQFRLWFKIRIWMNHHLGFNIGLPIFFFSNFLMEFT